MHFHCVGFIQVLFLLNLDTGPVAFGLLPPKLETLCLDDSSFEGKIEFGECPDSMECIQMDGSCFPESGNVDFNGLSHLTNLRELQMIDMELNGRIDTQNLPRSLEKLNLKDNNFTGIFDLGHLPEGLVKLFTSGNHFEYINQEHMPQSVRDGWDELPCNWRLVY